MYRLLLISYLPLFAILCPLIVAQSCNSTTGTYDSCCPSFANKTLTFQGREYRVHCDTLLGPSSNSGASNPANCASICKKECPLWRYDTVRGRGSCECSFFDKKPGKISFVQMDSELANDLDRCRADSKTSSDQVKDCQTKLGTCPSDLKTCQTGLNTCQTQCDKTCPSKLLQCQNDLKEANRKLLEKAKDCPPECHNKLDKCIKEKKKLCKCPKFQCTTSVKNIGGAKYRVHCNEFQGHRIPGQEENFKVKSMEHCARRCAESSRCQWAQYGVGGNIKGCTMNFDKWHRQRTETAAGNIPYLVLEKL